MKKYILMLLFIILPISIYSVDWNYYGMIINNKNLIKPGDIIVINSENGTSVSSFGHIAFVNKDHKVVDFKRLFKGYFEAPYYSFAPWNRKFKILRLKEEVTEELLNAMDEVTVTYYDKMYEINNSYLSDMSEYTYCSEFVYCVYKKALNKIGRDFSINGYNEDRIIYPLDFLNSDYLYEVDVR